MPIDNEEEDQDDEVDILSVESGVFSDSTNTISLPVLFVKHRDSTQDIRLSLAVHLLSGLEPAEVNAKIEKCGTQVAVTMQRPEEMLSAGLLFNCFKIEGSKTDLVFLPEHARTVATGQVMANEKQNPKNMFHSFIIPLPFDVEERFHKVKHVKGKFIVNYKRSGVKVLHFELVARRRAETDDDKQLIFFDVD